MQNNFKYINLSWAVVGFCEAPHQPLSSCIPGIEEDQAEAVEHYVIATTTRCATRPDRR